MHIKRIICQMMANKMPMKMKYAFLNKCYNAAFGPQKKKNYIK